MTGTSMTHRPLGRTGLEVTPICVGTSPLASMPGLYGYDVAHARAEATVAAVLDGPVNFIDTSNNYGDGNAEERIGAVLRARGGLPDGVVLATKADADRDTGDFSAARVRRSVEESLERLGLDRVPLMYLHDPEYHVTFEEAMADGGPVSALIALRDEGVVGHLGIASGPVDLMRRFVGTGVFEVALNHNRYTLLDRGAQPLIADAVQFSLRDPRVASTVVGVSEPAHVTETIELAGLPIPQPVWAELDRLAAKAGVRLD